MSTYFSVVAVHGLNGHAIRTWTSETSEKFWLGDEDLLPANLKRARVLTFNYNATVTALFGKTSSERILQHAHTLVAELVADRDVRPMFRNHGRGNAEIFSDSLRTRLNALLYSSAIRLGASWSREYVCQYSSLQIRLPIKAQALAYSASRTSKLVQHLHSIFVSTYAVLFLGTPHNGSSKASLASTARRMIDALVPSKVWDTNGQLLEALQEGSETLQNITDMFVPLMKNFRIHFFWEQEKTDFGVSLDYVRHARRVLFARGF